MNIKKLLQLILPIGWIKYYKTLKSRYHFRKCNCRIDSAYVSTKAEIGEHVTIAENCVIENTVSIGRYTYMQSGTNINNTKIGNFCSLGNNVLIAPWQHPLTKVSTSPKLYRTILNDENYSDLPNKTFIGNDVWIGSNAIILGGIHIGNGAVIGAGSVVTKDIPSYAIVVGNPARIVKFRFPPNIINDIEKSNWFEYDDYKILLNKNFLNGEFTV